MMGFRKRLLGLTVVGVVAVLLAGCSTGTTTPDYAPTPKTAVYGTGLHISKQVTADVALRQTVVTAIYEKVGTFDSAAHQQALAYDNLSAASFDLGANSPAFINGSRTVKRCAAGKAQGTDIGDGFYVVGDTLLSPTKNHTLAKTATLKQVKQAVDAVAVGKAASNTADAAVTVYDFKLKGGQAVKVRVFAAGDEVTGMQVSLVLALNTCYDLNTLPITSPEIVKMWKTQVQGLR